MMGSRSMSWIVLIVALAVATFGMIGVWRVHSGDYRCTASHPQSTRYGTRIVCHQWERSN